MDDKKLRRAALQPARVFGRRDFDPNPAEELLHFSLDGEDYWSPGFPTWLIADGDCKVLEKAIQNYGVREAPVNANWLTFGRRLTSVLDGKPLDELDELHDYELPNGTVATCYAVDVDGGESVFPATPVMYAERRFAQDVRSYRVERDYLRVIVEGKVVLVVRSLRPGTAVRWQPSAAA